MVSNPDASIAPYVARPIRFLGLHRDQGFTLKVYGITLGESAVAPILVDSAITIATEYLSAPPSTVAVAGIHWGALRSHGVGSLIIHEARDLNYVLLDVWVDETSLRHHVWGARKSTPIVLESLRDTDMAMCVWELAVIQHERAAWLRHAYRPDGATDIKAYLADVLNADV